MNSNSSVEQGAALIVTSAERAEALGIPSDRWVFPWAGTDAHDTWFVSQPGVAAPLAGHRHRRANKALELAGVGVDDLAHVDLYSCFPSRRAGGGHRAGPRPRPPAHRHRRAELRRRPVEQLRVPLDRHHGRASCGPMPAPSGSSPPTAASSPSTPSASTPRPRRPAAGSCTATARPRSTTWARSSWWPTTRAPSRIEGATVMHDRDGDARDGLPGDPHAAAATGPGPPAPPTTSSPSSPPTSPSASPPTAPPTAP